MELGEEKLGICCNLCVLSDLIQECGCCLVAKLCQTLFVIPYTVACQVPLSVEFPRQEYWRGLPFPPPGDILDPGI